MDVSSLSLIVNITRASDFESYRILPLSSGLLPTEQRDDNIDIHVGSLDEIAMLSFLNTNIGRFIAEPDHLPLFKVVSEGLMVEGGFGRVVESL